VGRSGLAVRTRRLVAILFRRRATRLYIAGAVFFGHESAGMRMLRPEIELGFGFFGSGFAFHLADGAFEHLSVKLEADGFNVAALFAAEHVACAAEFEIQGGDFWNPAAESENSLSAAERRRAEWALTRLRAGHEIGVGHGGWSGRTAAQLDRFREAEAGRLRLIRIRVA